jgi:nucleotide-binding universal stress UspA family protein
MMARRVLVVLEGGRSGLAALARARELVEHEGAEVTVLSVVPQALSGSRCGNSALEYNQMVIDSSEAELRRSRERFGPAAERATFQVLLEGTHPPLSEFVGQMGFDLVLLPARYRPLRSAGHPAAARLRRLGGAEVQVVDRRARPLASA